MTFTVLPVAMIDNGVAIDSAARREVALYGETWVLETVPCVLARKVGDPRPVAFIKYDMDRAEGAVRKLVELQAEQAKLAAGKA